MLENAIYHSIRLSFDAEVSENFLHGNQYIRARRWSFAISTKTKLSGYVQLKGKTLSDKKIFLFRSSIFLSIPSRHSPKSWLGKWSQQTKEKLTLCKQVAKFQRVSLLSSNLQKDALNYFPVAFQPEGKSEYLFCRFLKMERKRKYNLRFSHR